MLEKSDECFVLFMTSSVLSVSSNSIVSQRGGYVPAKLDINLLDISVRIYVFNKRSVPDYVCMLYHSHAASM